MIRAAIYLRVSTLDQARRGTTHREGFSIPAQRDACRKKAESLNVQVIKEYVDRGESARTADRPGLQQLLSDLREKKRFDYVIVHKIDRLARNVHDDVMIGLAIKHGGAQLVSVTENIDETPSGRLLHGIMATIAEFYSRNLALEAIKGSTEKAKQGGTPFQAPIGYLNVIERGPQRENRTIAVDDERYQLTTWGFEQYATGDYSERELQEALTKRGLRTRRGKSISLSALDRMLSNRYYLGYVTYCGIEYKGNHQPLVTPSVFAAVQLVRKMHSNKFRKQHKHYHSLARLLVCGRCGRPLCFALAKKRFRYFFCINRGRRNNVCEQPYIPVHLIEGALMKLLVNHSRNKIDWNEVERLIKDELVSEIVTAKKEIERQHRRNDRLKTEQERLLQAYYGALIQADVLKSEQKRLATEINQALSLIIELQNRLEVINKRQDRALVMVRNLDVGKCFANATPTIQRHFYQALFSSVTIDDQPSGPRQDYWWLRRHSVVISRVEWHNPINVHHLTEAILAMALKEEKGVSQ